MNTKNRPFLFLVSLVLASLILTACSGAPATQPPAPATQPPVAPVATEPPVVAPSEAPALPTAAPAAYPQEWKGDFQYLGNPVGISLLIEEVNGNSFTGRMLWHPTAAYPLTITKMNGEYVQDFSDAFEQGRWNNLPDFKSGDKSGIWLKWTETEMISGNTTFTMNGWYYAHIRADGKLVGIYYLNATETTPDASSYELTQVTGPVGLLTSNVITPGKSADGDTTQNSQLFYFEGTQGQVVSFVLTGAKNYQEFSIRDDKNEGLKGCDVKNNVTCSITDYTLPYTGVYYILVDRTIAQEYKTRQSCVSNPPFPDWCFAGGPYTITFSVK